MSVVSSSQPTLGMKVNKNVFMLFRMRKDGVLLKCIQKNVKAKSEEFSLDNDTWCFSAFLKTLFSPNLNFDILNCDYRC